MKTLFRLSNRQSFGNFGGHQVKKLKLSVPGRSYSASTTEEETPQKKLESSEKQDELDKLLVSEKEQLKKRLEKIDAVTNQSSYGFGYFSRILNSFLPPQMISSDKLAGDPAVTSSSKPVDVPAATVSKLMPKKTTVPSFVTLTRPSRSAIDERTRGLTRKVRSATSSASKLLRTEDLIKHLKEYPETRSWAVKEGAIQALLKFERRSSDDALRATAREGLSLLGYVPPPKGRGIRILSIDGGGTRGMMALEILEALEAESGGQRIHEMFDLVVGASTGAIIGSLLAGFRLTVPQCKEIYREISTRLFDQSRVYGVSSLLWSHSYYNTTEWINMLKEAIGERPMTDTARYKNSCKLCFVSCVVNKPTLEPYIFRNFNHAVGRDSVFPGSAGYKMWQGLQASAAAPGYFQEVKLDQWLHQDGGLLQNNPTAVGLHECKLLWPEEAIQCILSVGNGRSVLSVPKTPELVPEVSSLKEKIIKMVDSATDTEMVHVTMNDLLLPGTYFRLNPYMSYTYTLDEIDPKKLQQMKDDSLLYLRKNKRKLTAATFALLKRRTLWQKIKDYFSLQLRLNYFAASK